jgi:hypothetical protein
MIEFTERDKKLAHTIVSDPTMLAFIKKVFVLPQEQFTPEQVANMSNGELGELVKADVLAQQKILKRYTDLKRLAIEKNTKSSPTAPK